MLSFATPISYDWLYALDAIESYYAIADEIILGIDKESLTWAGNKVVIPPEFFACIEGLDKDKKIKIISDYFCTELNPMDNDIRERTILANSCKEGNWVVQIDSDEVIQNQEEFRDQILSAPKDCQVRMTWKTLFKRLPEGDLYISPHTETTTVASMDRHSFVSARVTNQKAFTIKGFLLHNSWGRTELELYTKLTNWGHAFDFPVNQYFEFWKGVNAENYSTFKNFHPLDQVSWKELTMEPR